MVIVLRTVQTGRVWGAPADFLSKGGSLGPGAIVVNWAVGAVAIAASWHAFRSAKRTTHGRKQLASAASLLALTGLLVLPSVQYIPGLGAVKNITGRSHSVITGIERYKEDHGQYPRSLAELVPDYLRESPSDLYRGRQVPGAGWGVTAID